MWDYEEDAEKTGIHRNNFLFHNFDQLRSKEDTDKMVEIQSEKKKITNEIYNDSDKNDANVDSDTHNIEQSQEDTDHVVRTYILVCTLCNYH